MKRAVDMTSHKQVAVKILKIRTESYKSKKVILEHFLREIKILSKCSHVNIVRLLDASF